MPDTSDRLTRLETLLEISVQNQNASRERHHDLANNLQSISARLDALSIKMDDVKVLQAEVAHTNERLDVHDADKARMQTIWSIGKWMGTVMGGCFTLALTFGDRVIAWPFWSLFK